MLAGALSSLSGCGGGGGGGGGGGSPAPTEPPGFDDEPSTPPGTPVATNVVVAAIARDTSTPLALLSSDPATGDLGILPGSPLAIGAATDDQATVIFDSARRRI